MFRRTTAAQTWHSIQRKNCVLFAYCVNGCVQSDNLCFEYNLCEKKFTEQFILNSHRWQINNSSDCWKLIYTKQLYNLTSEKDCPVRLAQSVERCGSQSEGPGFKSRRRRWDSSVGQTANGPCLSRLSCINEYKVFLRCPPVYGEPPQRPSAGAMGHHPRCFARSISSQRGY